MLDKIKNVTTSLSARVKSRGKKSDQYLVGLDIGTEYVKALICKITEGGAEIIGVGRARQNMTDMQAGAIADIAGVVDNCNKALMQAEQQAGQSPKTAVIGIAGELVKGTTINVRCVRKDSTRPLDTAEVEKIVTLVQQKAEAKARSSLAWELGGKEVEVRLVNSALVSIVIDGYNVTNPVGFSGKDVVIQLYTAFAPMIHIGAIERVAQDLDLDLLAVAAEPFAVARSVVGDNLSSAMSAILMDVGGGTTDIAVINDGGVQGTKMFGIGGRAFTRSVERELNLSFDQAEAKKIALSTNKIDRNEVEAVSDALSKTLDVWIGGVELGLSEFTAIDHLPHQILLCGGGSSLEMLSDALNTSQWYRQLPFTKKPIIQHIRPDQVVGIKDKTGDVQDHTLITAMGLVRVGLDTLSQEESSNENGNIMKKIDKILSV